MLILNSPLEKIVKENPYTPAKARLVAREWIRQIKSFEYLAFRNGAFEEVKRLPHPNKVPERTFIALRAKRDWEVRLTKVIAPFWQYWHSDTTEEKEGWIELSYKNVMKQNDAMLRKLRILTDGIGHPSTWTPDQKAERYEAYRAFFRIIADKLAQHLRIDKS